MKIDCNHIGHMYDGVEALKNISLEIQSGELIALLGPSGCGKTTLLKLIAGLMKLQEGTLYFGDLDISSWEPQQRNAAMVFQSYALFPHMTVAENIGYGLNVRGLKKNDLEVRVATYMEKVHLTGFGDRKIQALSGGQQQRVALARALILSPDVLLFDEPLSNLDEKLRVDMRREIKRLQKESGITSIYVTHDQEEAMAIADRIVVMDSGAIQQIGTPEEVYHEPANTFVASFMGTSNIIEHRGERRLYRPESIYLNKNGTSEGLVLWMEHLGSIQQVCIETEHGELISERFSKDVGVYPIGIGDRVLFNFESDGYLL